MSKYCLSVLILISLMANSYGQDFCGDNNETLKNMYIISDFIYIGNDSLLWKYNINKKSMNPKRHPSPFSGAGGVMKVVESAVHFDLEPCKDSTTFCDNTRKAIEKVIAIGRLTTVRSSPHGYNIFRVQGDKSLINAEKSEVPWDLGTSGSFTEKFWEEGDLTGNHLAVTFDQTKNIFYDLTEKGMFYVEINSDSGMIDRTKTPYNMSTSKPYKGLVDYKGVLYGLGESNNVFELSVGPQKVDETKEWSAYEFFNCNKSSPLDLDSNATPSGNNTDDGNTTTPEASKSNDTTPAAVSPGSDGNKPDADETPLPDGTTTTGPSSNKGSSTLIIIIIVVIIIVIIVAIVICLFRCKKSKDTEEKHEDAEQAKGETPNEVPPGRPTDGSKAGSKTGELSPSVSKTGSTTGVTGSGSKTGSKIGGSKSMESIQTVRSKKSQTN